MKDLFLNIATIAGGIIIGCSAGALIEFTVKAFL